MTKQHDDLPDRADTNLKPLYVRSVINSFSSNTISPFLGIYAVQLGASGSEMGWLQAMSSLSPSALQLMWGKLSDNLGRRVPFILIGGLITSFLWIPLMFVSSAEQLILVTITQAVFAAMVIPAWTALIGDAVPSSIRGKITASINFWATLGGLGATLLSGYILAVTKGTWQEIFFLPLFIALVCGTASSLVMLIVKERPRTGRTKLDLSFRISDVTKRITANPLFSRYCLVSSVYGFFMAMSWPLFSITMIRVLKASMLEIASITILQGAITILVQLWAGRLVDRIGRKPFIIIDRFGLVLIPIFYAFAPNIYYIIALNGVLGISIAYESTAMVAYQLDVIPKEHRAGFSAFYNLATGIAYFAGSLIGGYFSDYLFGIVGTLLALQIVYVISACGRGISAVAHFSIKEPYNASTLRKELRETLTKHFI